MQRLVAVLALLFLLAAPAAARDRRLAAPYELAEANTAFAWDLYDRLRAGDENLFFSPYSISTALTMTREGANRETAAQMDKVLHLKGVSDRGMGYRGLASRLAAPLLRDGNDKRQKRVPAYELVIANRLWGHKGFGFEAGFVETLDKTVPSGGDIVLGGLRISPSAQEVSLDGNPVQLTTHEFELLVLLAKHAGTVLSRDDIFHNLRGIDYDGLDRSIDGRISKLRKKLDDSATEPARIKTVWGKGYLLVPDAWGETT